MKILSCADGLEDAFDALNTSKVILAPTETVYGLLCNYDDSAAANKIYELKKRPKSKLLAAFLPSTGLAEKYVDAPIPAKARALADKFCPGPITIVIPDGKNSTFGFRIPNHPFILALLEKFGGAIGSTSANLSGTPAALNIKDALATLNGTPDVIIDGGVIPQDSLPSTVVMVNADNTFKILRPGPVTEQMIMETSF